MKPKKLGLFLLCLALTVTQHLCFAQSTNPEVKAEALKKLLALDPFKITPQQGQSFDPQQGKGLYFEDGTILSFEQFSKYVGMPEREYVVVPYADPSNQEKVVAMLVRKATAEEKEALKGLVSVKNAKNYKSEGMDMSDPESAKAIAFDPSLKAKDFIKGLTKLPKGAGSTLINSGRVAHFDENGNLIPLELPDKKGMNPEFKKYERGKDVIGEMYMDEDEIIRAIVYRKATMEERKLLANAKIIEASVGAGDGSEMSGSARLAGSGGDNNNNGAAKESKSVGEAAINFKSSDINGHDVELSSFKGKKVVVINFWFIHCNPCVMEMPDLNKLVDEYKGKDVEFISISTDNKEAVESFFLKTEFKYRCIPGGFNIANKYEVIGFPTHVVIDKKGKIVFSDTGVSPTLIPSLRDEINKALK